MKLQYNSMDLKVENNIKEEVLLRDHLIRRKAPVPDVDAEFNKFMQKREMSRKSLFWLGSSAGAAAAAAIFVIFNLFSTKTNADFSSTVFMANHNSSDVVFQTNYGTEIPLQNSYDAAFLNKVGASLSDSGEEIVYHTDSKSRKKADTQIITTPRQKDFKIVLSDGTEVWLNAESQLIYPSHFESGERIVKLRGEAYFKVKADPEHPFIVETEGLHTKALGTEFNVNSYSINNPSVTLITGSVEVENPAKKEKIRINPGEAATLDTGGSLRVSKVDTEHYVQWKDGYFYFDNMPLVDIIRELGRWYNMDIVFLSSDILEMKLHFIADRHAPPEDAIDILNSLNKMTVISDNNKIYIK